MSEVARRKTLTARFWAVVSAAALVVGGVTVATVTTAPRDVQAVNPTKVASKKPATSKKGTKKRRSTRISARATTIKGKKHSHLSRDHRYIFKSVNKERKANKVKTLKKSAKLDKVAQKWAKHMATIQTMYHNPKVGSEIPKNWQRWGENVAHSMSSGDNAAIIHTLWMNSPGHRANILNEEFTHMGVGVYVHPQNERWTWAVQVFATYKKSPDAKPKDQVRVKGKVTRTTASGRKVAYKNKRVKVYHVKPGSKKRVYIGRAKTNGKGRFHKKFTHPGKGKIVVRAAKTKTYKASKRTVRVN